MKLPVLRIRHAPEMEALGLAGLVGECQGYSVPSVSGVEVSGPCPRDFAVNVYVDERDEGYWVAPEFVELVEPAAEPRSAVSGGGGGRGEPAAGPAAELRGPPAPRPAAPRSPGRAGRAEANFIGRLLDRLWPD